MQRCLTCGIIFVDFKVEAKELWIKYWLYSCHYYHCFSLWWISCRLDFFLIYFWNFLGFGEEKEPFASISGSAACSADGSWSWSNSPADNAHKSLAAGTKCFWTDSTWTKCFRTNASQPIPRVWYFWYLPISDGHKFYLRFSNRASTAGIFLFQFSFSSWALTADHICFQQSGTWWFAAYGVWEEAIMLDWTSTADMSFQFPFSCWASTTDHTCFYQSSTRWFGSYWVCKEVIEHN